MSNYKLGRGPVIVVQGQPRFKVSALPVREASPSCVKPDQPSLHMGFNNKYGDCTAVGLMNSASVVSSLNGAPVACSDSDAIRFYSESTGFNPEDPSTDRGGVEVGVLDYASRNGMQFGFYKLFPLWGTVNMLSRNDLALACEALGSVYLGIDLAEADQFSLGALWDTTTLGNQAPGSWGGHCALLYDYSGLGDEDTIRIATWGGLQKATWRWLESRIVEAHGIIWPQLASPVGKFLSTENFSDIRKQNAAFLEGQ